MTTWLREDMRCFINTKRVERLYKLMGLQTNYPIKNLSKRNQLHKVYPYQFTSPVSTKISMNGNGRAFDNIFILNDFGKH